MSDALRIVLVEPNPSGGLFQFAYQLGDALAQQGHRVELLTGPRPELLSTHPNLAVLAVLPTWHGGEGNRTMLGRKVRRALRAVRYVAAWAVVLRHVRRGRPHVVQLGEWRFWIDGVLAAFLVKRHWALVVVDLAHSPIPLEEQRYTGSIYRRGPLLSRGLHAGYRAMDTVIVLGQSSRRDLLTAWPRTRRVEVIPHGDETALVHGEPDRPGECEPLAVFFGSLSTYKGLDVLLDAHAMVLDMLPAARLLIAGPLIPDLDEVELRRRAAALHGVTLQVGYVPINEVAPLVGSARVVVAPYRRSNASGVVRLAQTLGRPVVVTDVGDLADSVDDGATGFVVAAEDPASLAQAMRRLLDDGALADQMGNEGRKRLLATASWPIVAQRVSGIYLQLLSRQEGAPRAGHPGGLQAPVSSELGRGGSGPRPCRPPMRDAQ